LLFATFTDAAVLLCCCAAVVLYVVQAVQYVVCDVFSSNKKSRFICGALMRWVRDNTR
jgi:hypothetical protein